jgi:protein involved in polysaccharide export with SLBB domain
MLLEVMRKCSMTLLFGVLGLSVAQAQQQTPTPTAEQIEIFQSLTPEQQQAVLEQMGAQGAVTDEKRDKSLATPETVTPRSVNGKTPAGTSRLPSETSPFARTTRASDNTIKQSDSLLLKVSVRPLEATAGTTEAPQRSQWQTSMLSEAAARLQRGNPYTLDANGMLHIAGADPIRVVGLTEKQATDRINADPDLREFDIQVTWLPFESDQLQPFGYDLFAGVPSTFAPVTDVPVPSEYVVGPGDRLDVQLIGNSKGRYSLVVNREGRVLFPELGPIHVAGMRFADAKAAIEARVREQMIGTQVVVSMGELRSIRVFVLGEAERPGSYTVSGLATITNALFVSGGVKTIGSLRNLQLKRSGKLVRKLDLYDLLLNGDTKNDVRLQPGDVIFIPPVGPTAGVKGEVRRPAIYELKGPTSAGELVRLGGGLTPDADPRLARIERIGDARDHVVIDVNLDSDSQRQTGLRTGDVLDIPAARPSYSNAIEIKGHVYRPRSIQYRGGLHVTDVIPTVDELREDADLNYVVIRREAPGTRVVSTVSVDMGKAWAQPHSASDPLLQARDQILVFDRQSGRKQYLVPVVEELRRQAVSTQPSRIVHVAGNVRMEGDYPLDPGMHLSDLVRAGGGLAEQAYPNEAELARYESIGGKTRQTEVLKVDLNAALAGDPQANLLLQPYDTLVIKQISEWTQQESVVLQGEVQFPGVYPIERGETLRSVIERAGGLTPLAFAKGSVFTRESLKQREKEQIHVLVQRLKQDLGTLALQGAQFSGATGGAPATQAAETLQIGQGLLKDLENVEPVGRLVIDLDRAMAANAGDVDDLILKDGDILRVPKRAQEVTVIGEVQTSTSSHLYDPSLSRDDYLRMSGGTTSRADEKRIYVVRANGSVQASSGSRWFASDGTIEPGDTIVVPLDAERMRPLALWTQVTRILYNVAIAVAAVGSL